MKTTHIILIGVAVLVVGYFIYKNSASTQAKDMMKNAAASAAARAAAGKSGASLSGSSVG